MDDFVISWAGAALRRIVFELPAVRFRHFTTAAGFRYSALNKVGGPDFDEVWMANARPYIPTTVI